jgi:hypothetical protein
MEGGSAMITQLELEEKQRIMRKQLASWCDSYKLTKQEVDAVNQVIASSAAARYPDVKAVMNSIDLGKALSDGQTITGITARQLFIAAVVNTCARKGIPIATEEKKWPPFAGMTIVDLSQAV